MTKAQQKILNSSIPSILQFFVLGKSGDPNPPRLGDFAREYKAKWPVQYILNKELITLIDAMIVAAFNAGVKSH